MIDDFTRSIVFTITGNAKVPGVRVHVEEDDGALVFSLDILGEKHLTGNLRALFFDFNDSGKLGGLQGFGPMVTGFATGDVIDLGHGANLRGAARGFDAGIEFGTPGGGRSDVTSVNFTLTNSAGDLSLDDIANTLFGSRLTAVGNPAGGGSGSAKLTTIAPAAPDAVADSYIIFEDGQPGLNHPAQISEGVLFDVLANDTDQDGDTLTIVAVQGASHGLVEIVDGPDADDLPGDAILYTPDRDYCGPDSFTYLISDNNGGTDFASVEVVNTAVADIPTMTCTVLEGATVNEVIVRVSASQTDTDSSEFIDRIILDGIPAGITVSESVYNPSGEPDALSRDFLLTLPGYADTAFDLGVTVVTKESSNGDEEVATTSLPIVYEMNVNQFDPVFTADDHSMWGTGQAWSFEDNRFIGVNSTIDDRLSASLAGVGSAYADYDIDFQVGLQSSLDISSGVVDASVPYAVDIMSRYNETTDWLRFETDAFLDLDDSWFSTQSPLLLYTLDLMADVQSTIKFGASIDIPGTPAVVVLGETVVPAIPGWSWGGSTTENFGFDETVNLAEFDGDSLNLMGLEGDSAVTYDLGGPFSVTAEIPHFDTWSQVEGDYLASSGSDNFLGLNVDIDDLLTKLLGLPVNPFGESIDFGHASVGYDLLNYGMTGSLGVGQEFSLSFGDLHGSLEFEDGFRYDFIAGENFDIHNASSHDSNLDGVLDVSLFLEPDATFASNLLLTQELTHTLELLDAYLSVSVPVFDDPEFHLGPAESYQNTLADNAIELIGVPSFDFDLGSASDLFTV